MMADSQRWTAYQSVLQNNKNHIRAWTCSMQCEHFLTPLPVKGSLCQCSPSVKCSHWLISLLKWNQSVLLRLPCLLSNWSLQFSRRVLPWSCSDSLQDVGIKCHDQSAGLPPPPLSTPSAPILDACACLASGMHPKHSKKATPLL